MYILDSDIIIWILREKLEVIQAVRNIISHDQTGISTISIAEIYKNVFPEEIPNTEFFISRQQIFVVTTEIAKSSGFYWHQFYKNNQGLSLPDCIIAATAQKEKAKLLTLNGKHFPMKDINIINPLYDFRD